MRTDDSDCEHLFTRLASERLAQASISISHIWHDALWDAGWQKLLSENCFGTAVDCIDRIPGNIRFVVYANSKDTVRDCFIDVGKTCIAPDIVGADDLSRWEKLTKRYGRLRIARPACGLLAKFVCVVFGSS